MPVIVLFLDAALFLKGVQKSHMIFLDEDLSDFLNSILEYDTRRKVIRDSLVI